MQYTKNTIFRYNFQDVNDENYSLFFVPADDTDLISPTIVDLPNKCILPELTLSYGFEDDLPKGLALAKTLKFSVDRNEFIGDFEVVGSWLFRNYATITYIDRTLIIPNHFYLFKGEQLIFDGLHDVKPSRKTEIEFKTGIGRTEIFEIECLDNFRVSAERCLLSDLNLSSNTIEKNMVCYDNIYNSFSDTNKSLWSGGELFILRNNQNFWTEIFTKINTISQYLTRNYDIYAGSNPIGSYNLPFDNCSFFKKTYANNGSKGTELNVRTDIYYMILIKNDLGASILGGLLSEKSENGFYKEYNNCWDLIKSATETSYQKAVIINGFIGVGNGNKLSFLPALEDLELDGNNIHYRAYKLIKSSDILGKTISIENGYKNIANASYVINDLNSDCINDFQFQSNGILNQDSQDLKLFMENKIHVPIGYLTENSLFTERTYIRNFYYVDTAILMQVSKIVKMNCSLFECDVAIDINIGNGITLSQTDAYPFERPLSTFTKPEKDNESYKNYVSLVNYTNNSNGLGKAFVDLSFRLFEGDKQGMIEIELKNDKVTTNDLGDVFEFDSDILPSELNTKAILTNISEDIKQGLCKCKFFLLGD